jgi:hypothetical protein
MLLELGAPAVVLHLVQLVRSRRRGALQDRRWRDDERGTLEHTSNISF